MGIRAGVRLSSDYALSVPATLLAVGLRFALSPWLGDRSALTLPLAVVMAAASSGGFGPGLLTGGLCLLAWTYCFIEPTGGFVPARFGDRVDLTSFIVVAVILSRWGQVLVDVRHRGRQADLLDEVGAERKRAEEADARLAAIVESSDDAIVGKDLRGVITSWNAGAEQLFGYTAEEAVGANVTLIIPRERLAEEAEILGRIRDGIAVDHYETVRCRKDGHLVDVSLTVSPIRDATGRVIGASKIARDFTGRKHAEEANRQKLAMQRQLALIAESIPGVICTFRRGPDGSVSLPFATPAIEDLYGLPPAVLAEDFSSASANVHPDDLQNLGESIDESFRAFSPWHGKFRYNHPTKGQRWVEGWSRPVAESGGGVLWHGFLMDVTHSEESEAARRETERLARSVLDSIASHIALLDESGAILDVNRSWRSFAEANGADGRVSEGANYLEVCDSVTGEDRETASTFAAGIRAVLAGQQALLELEYPCHSPTRRRWFVGRITPFVEGGPRRVVVSHEDVTALKKAEEGLRDRERMLARSQMMAHVGSWELELDDLSNLNRNALRWSDECYRIFGHEPEGVTSDLFFAAVHPDDRDSVVAELARSLERGGIYEIEHRIRRPDGEERIVHEWGEIVADPGGRPLRILGTCQDVTEGRRAQDALRESEERLALAVESAGLGIWDRDLLHDRIRWSPRQEELLGFAPGEFDGTYERLIERVHPEDREGRERAITLALDNHEIYQHEFRFVLPDGSIRWIACHGRFAYDDSGRAVRLAGVAQDITERKQAEDTLRNSASRLAHLREIEAAILSARSPREIAEATLDHLIKLIPCRMGGIALFDFARGQINPIATIGILGEWAPSWGQLPSFGEDSPRVVAARYDSVVVVDDAAAGRSEFPPIEALRDRGLRSYAYIPLRNRGELLGFLLMGSDRPSAYTPDHLEVAREVANPLAIAIHQALLFDELRAARERAEALARQVIRAGEDERRRIARELHDEIGQALTALKINIQTVAGVNDPSLRLEDSLAIVDQALRQVRGMALDLRPSLLDDLGMVAALEWYIRRHAERTGLAGRFVADPEDIRAHPEIETTCFRIAQEALTNVARHARASRFSVELLQHSGGLQLVVRDDGIGFDPEPTFRAASRGASMGLAGMRERAELVGGRIAFVSGPGQGTEVQVEFPNAPIVPDAPRHQRG
jgi:PAS domain S-box-containing protein